MTGIGASLPLDAGATNDEVCPILLKNSIDAVYWQLSEGFLAGLMSLSYWNY
jgi:hypothetical protein